MSSWPSVHTQHWLQALSRRGHEVHFILPPAKSPTFEGIPEKVILHEFSWQSPVKGTGALALALELRDKLRRIKPDIFHVHSVFAVGNWKLFSWVAAMCTFHPLVLTAWGGDLLNTPQASRAGRLFVRFAVRSADLITADSLSLLEAAHELGAPRERLHEVQFGVDTESFRQNVETGSLRSDLDLGSGPIVYSPRAFMPVYNQTRIVEAVPAVLRVFPDCKFIFKRRSDHHSPANEEDVRRKIEELNIAAAVRFVPDISQEKLPALYALSDVVISVPDFDGTPRSVLEAMACGAYPVVSDLPALREWITCPENGLFVPSIEPKLIAAALIEALSSPETLKAAQPRNRQIIETRASSAHWVGKMEALYGTLLSSGK